MAPVVVSEINRWFRRRKTLAISMGLFFLCMLVGFYTFYGQHRFPGPFGPNAYLAFVSVVGSAQAPIWGLFLPLNVSLIAADTLLWDRKTGQIQFYLARTTRLSYGMGKFMATMLITGATICIGLLITLAVAALLFPAGSPVVAPEYPTFLHAMFYSAPIGYCLILTGIITLSVMAWASLSFLASLWTTNIYLVIAGPWLLYLLLTFVVQVPPLSAFDYTPAVLSTGLFIQQYKGLTYFVGIPILWVAVISVGALLTFFHYHRGLDIFD